MCSSDLLTSTGFQKSINLLLFGAHYLLHGNLPRDRISYYPDRRIPIQFPQFLILRQRIPFLQIQILSSLATILLHFPEKNYMILLSFLQEGSFKLITQKKTHELEQMLFEIRSESVLRVVSEELSRSEQKISFPEYLLAKMQEKIGRAHV